MQKIGDLLKTNFDNTGHVLPSMLQEQTKKLEKDGHDKFIQEHHQLLNKKKDNCFITSKGISYAYSKDELKKKKSEKDSIFLSFPGEKE